LDAINKVSSLISNKLNDPLYKATDVVQNKQDSQIADINNKLENLTKAAENFSKASAQQAANVQALLKVKSPAPAAVLVETSAQAEISKLKKEVEHK